MILTLLHYHPYSQVWCPLPSSLSRNQTQSCLTERQCQKNQTRCVCPSRPTSTIVSSWRPVLSPTAWVRISRRGTSALGRSWRFALVTSLTSTSGRWRRPGRSGASVPMGPGPTCWSTWPREFSTSTRSRTVWWPVSSGQPKRWAAIHCDCSYISLLIHVLASSRK